MKYNVSETPLRLREYGRNVQSMVEYIKTIDDREKRTLMAEEVVKMMVALNPSLKDHPEYHRKLWDHLYIIADFDLDVDGPYPIPDRSVAFFHATERLPYYREKPRLRQHGVHVQMMVEKAMTMEDEEKQKAYINLIANTMKLFLRRNDRDSNPEQLIANQIKDLSKGKLKVDPKDIHLTKTPIKNQPNNDPKPSRGRSSKRRKRRKR